MINLTASSLYFSKSRLALYAIILAWAVLIFYLSTGTFGSDFTKAVLERELFFFHLSVSSKNFHVLDTLQRKAAHFIVYGILATLLYSTFVGQVSFRGWLRRAILCVVIAGGRPILIELHEKLHGLCADGFRQGLGA